MEFDSNKRNHGKKYSPATLCNVLNNFRKNRKFCDVTLEVDNVEYFAHKAILIGFSPFFEGMFSGSFLEATESKVKLSSIDAITLEQILDYIYTGDFRLTQDNVTDVLHAANFLQADSLFEECCRFLENNIDAKNCLGIWSLSEVYSCTKLRESSEKYILEHFAEVSNESEFLELGAENLHDIVKNDHIKVEKEEIVFDAVIRWFYFKEKEREPHLAKLLSDVRLAHLDPNFLISRVRTIEAIQKSSVLMRLVEEAKTYFLLKNRRAEFQSSITRRRFTSSSSEVILVFRNYKHTNIRRNIFLTEDGQVIPPDTWTSTLFPRPTHLIKPSNYDMWLVRTSATDPTNYMKYEQNTGWITIVPSCLPNAVLQKVDGNFYGLHPKEITPEVTTRVPESVCYKNLYRYDDDTKSWIPTAPLPDAVSEPILVSEGGFLYVLGKGIPKKACIKVQRYDPYTNTWEVGTTLPKICCEPHACVINKRIYVCSLKIKKVYMYDCETRKWGHCAPLTNQLDVGCLAVMNGRLFAISKRPDAERVIERYIPAKDSWQEFAICPDTEITFITGPFLYSRDLITALEDKKVELLVTS